MAFARGAPPAAAPAVARHADTARDRARWRSRWAGITLAAGIAATAVDAALLQRKRAYFTGGFLSVDHISSPSQAIAFVAGSVVADAVVLGAPVALALWACGRFTVARLPATVIALAAALAPVLVADVLTYQLLDYLGDAFDLNLMFDLTGRSPGEVLAVSSAHLAGLAWLGGGIALAVAGVFWTLMRRSSRLRPPVERIPLRSAGVVPIVVVMVGAGVTAAVRTSSDVLDNGLRRKPTGSILGTIVNALSDVDGDGYGVLGRPADPDLFDARIHPYALDVPGNGVDENGVAGDLPAGVEPYREPPLPGGPWRSHPDVVLIVLESFRADAVGATVGGKPVTPVLDALAARGVSVRHAYSHNGYTVQSRRHIFSGSTADIGGSSTLLDDFRANGYQTAYFSAQDESFGGTGQGVGFDRADVAYDARADRNRRYSTFTTAGSLAVPYNVLLDRVGAFLDTRRRERPLFLYVNFHDTHFPYRHPGIAPLVSRSVLAQSDITPGHADTLRAMYLNTAANVDRAIGSVLEHARRSLGREPGVIVLGDHGESLFDEGFLGHGYALNDAQTRIPLIVANLPVTIEDPFGQADLRGIIDAALASPVGAAAAPVVGQNAARRVFQYLGNIDRPAQIGLATSTGRTIYDFRSDEVQVDRGAWRRSRDLRPGELAAFTALVRIWERMLLARQSAPVAPDQRARGGQ